MKGKEAITNSIGKSKVTLEDAANIAKNKVVKSQACPRIVKENKWSSDSLLHVLMLRFTTAEVYKCYRMLAYGLSADSNDDYVRMAESTTLECFNKFIRGVIKVFGNTYLKRPNNDDIERLLQIGEARGFPGMLGSIDCMYWEWKNCTVALKGQFYRGDNGVPTMMLEAVASLNQPNVFDDVLHGRASKAHYSMNQHEYNLGYYLADGIYPEWTAFVKSISLGQSIKRKLFTKKQESDRKDIEWAFEVLQARFAIIHCRARAWHYDQLRRIMYACIILHNMILEDERDTYSCNIDYSYDHVGNDPPGVSNNPHPDFQEYLCNRFHLRDRSDHQYLQADLVEHIWDKF